MKKKKQEEFIINVGKHEISSRVLEVLLDDLNYMGLKTNKIIQKEINKKVVWEFIDNNDQQYNNYYFLKDSRENKE